MEKNCKIVLDTRNQKDGFVEQALNDLGYSCIRSKLPFGDVALSTDILRCVDLKSSGGGLLEVAKNFCSRDHARVRNEIINCFDNGGEITFLCFEDGMTCLEDIQSWQVPRYKTDAYQTKYLIAGTWFTNKQIEEQGIDVRGKSTMRECLHRKGEPMTKLSPMTLYKTMRTVTMPNRYAPGKTVGFEFIDKAHCGQKIIEILTRG